MSPPTINMMEKTICGVCMDRWFLAIIYYYYSIDMRCSLSHTHILHASLSPRAGRVLSY